MLTIKSKSYRKITYAAILLLILWLILRLSAINTPIDIYSYNVNLKRLPEHLDGLRIVQLSDIHLGPFVPESLVEQTVDRVNQQNPDIVAITGDFTSHSARYTEKCMRIISKIISKHGIYLVAGNHDHKYGIEKLETAADKYNLKLLMNCSEEPIDGLRIVGIDDETRGNMDIRKATSGLKKNDPVLILTHEPPTSRFVHEYNALVLTGHTHGGQVNIPYITHEFLWKSYRYSDGWYKVNKAKMYVNRGIGFNGFLPIRFRCNSEITVFNLKTKEQNESASLRQ